MPSFSPSGIPHLGMGRSPFGTGGLPFAALGDVQEDPRAPEGAACCGSVHARVFSPLAEALLPLCITAVPALQRSWAGRSVPCTFGAWMVNELLRAEWPFRHIWLICPLPHSNIPQFCCYFKELPAVELRNGKTAGRRTYHTRSQGEGSV